MQCNVLLKSDYIGFLGAVGHKHILPVLIEPINYYFKFSFSLLGFIKFNLKKRISFQKNKRKKEKHINDIPFLMQ